MKPHALSILVDAFERSHTSGKILLALQVIAHASLVPMLMHATSWQWVGCLIVYFLLTCVGISVTYHRLLTHKSWKAPEWFRKFGIFCGVISAVGTPLSFVSQHRDHHRYLDKPQDVYSTANKPFWYVQWFAMLEPISLQSASDLFKDRFCVHMHKYFFVYHLLYFSFLFIVDPFAVVYLYLVPVALTWNVANSLNTICHQRTKTFWGYRNIDQTDSSVSVSLIGLISFGEGWHANHHANPRNVCFQNKWWEIDIGYVIIRAFAK